MTEEAVRRHLDDFGALLERVEGIEGADVSIADGIIAMSPITLEHVRTCKAVSDQLAPLEAIGLEIVGDVKIIHPSWTTYRCPDLVVWDPPKNTEEDVEGRGFHSSRVRLAVEVVSVSSAENDHIVKVREYGAAGIPVYLVLDPYTRQAVIHRSPDPDGYRAAERFTYGQSLPLTEPTPGTLDTAQLPVAPPHKQRAAWPFTPRA